METIMKRIEQLKKEKDVAILAHYYTDNQIQSMADYVGDSYYLSKTSAEIPQKTILFCGVSFMGESAKLLSPEKTIIMPNSTAHCPMADMVDIDEIKAVRGKYEDVAVVCYVNSTAEIKAHSDVCVTSANALTIVKALPNKNIYFIPDANLGKYIQSIIPEKNFVLGDGFCHVHTSIKKENIQKTKELYPKALILAHPECTQDVLEMADYIGSTSGIINYAEKSDAQVFIICTEMGILYELESKNPDKKFYSVGHRQFCPHMKCITVEQVLEQLENANNFITLDEEKQSKASRALEKMMIMSE